jgi:flagellar export protein FliJ
MAKYKFRLETLRKVRDAYRNRQRARLAEAYRADDVLNQQRAELTAERMELRRQQHAAFNANYTDVNRLMAAGRYEHVLKARQQMLDQQQTLLGEEIERRRQALLEADREVRVLELLDERGREEHRQTEVRAEGKQLDEVGIQRAWRDQCQLQLGTTNPRWS